MGLGSYVPAQISLDDREKYDSATRALIKLFTELHWKNNADARRQTIRTFKTLANVGVSAIGEDVRSILKEKLKFSETPDENESFSEVGRTQAKLNQYADELTAGRWP